MLLLVIGLPIAVARAVRHGNSDLCGFCAAGRYVLEHGNRDPASALSRYWPSADIPWMALAYLPSWLAAAIWYLIGCGTWLGLLRTVFRVVLSDSDPTVRRHCTLAAALLTMPLVVDGLCLGSFHVLMLWLMLSGVHRACRGQTWSGGILLGLAVWLKLLPFLGAAFLLWQRKTAAAVLAVAFAVMLDVALSVGAFGAAGAWHEHVVWWNDGAAGTTNRQLTCPVYGDEDRLTNQSVAITLRRLFSTLGMLPNSPRQFVLLTELTGPDLQKLYVAANLLLLGGVAVFCWPRKGAVWDMRLSAQTAMVLLATLWLSPVIWSYHFTAATPALAILIEGLHRQQRRWMWLVICLWLGGLCLLAFPVARAGGVLLWLSLLVGAALAWLGDRKGAEGSSGEDSSDPVASAA